MILPVFSPNAGQIGQHRQDSLRRQLLDIMHWQ